MYIYIRNVAIIKHHFYSHFCFQKEMNMSSASAQSAGHNIPQPPSPKKQRGGRSNETLAAEVAPTIIKTGGRPRKTVEAPSKAKAKSQCDRPEKARDLSQSLDDARLQSELQTANYLLQGQLALFRVSSQDSLEILKFCQSKPQ